MISLQQTWLYQQLANIYGKESLVMQAFPPSERLDEYTYYQLKNGMESMGWIGIEKGLLSEEADQLIQLLLEQQSHFFHHEEDMEERYWKLFLQEEMMSWKEKWKQLAYPEHTAFGHIYVYTEDDIQDPDIQLSIKELVGEALEQKTFLIPLYHHTFVWIIPDFNQVKDELESMLEGLVDTIVSECMVDVQLFVGDTYMMPHALHLQVQEELAIFQLAIQYGWEQRILSWLDIIPLLLMRQCQEKDLHRLVDKLLGPVREDQELLHSLETFLQNNLNVSETAKQLFIHRNSLQYRLDKFMEKTGLDIRQFEVGVNVYLAMKALQILDR